MAEKHGRLQAIPLEANDIRPIIPEHVKQRVVNAAVLAVLSTASGRRLEAAHVRSIVGKNFERLCDGIHFDFGPLSRALQKSATASDADVFLAYAILSERLRPLQIRVSEPTVELIEADRTALEKRARYLISTDASRIEGEPAKSDRPLKLGELLVKYQLLSEDQLRRALRAQSTFGGRLGTNLVELGLIDEDALTHFLSVQLGLPSADARMLSAIPGHIVDLFPRDLAEEHRVVPIGIVERKLMLAMADPTDLPVIDAVAFKTGYRVQPVVAAERLIAAALAKYFGIERETRRRAESLVPASEVSVEEEFQVVHTSRRRDVAASLEKKGVTISVEDRGHFFDSERVDFVKNDDLWTALSTDLAKSTEPADVVRVVTRLLARDFEWVKQAIDDRASIFGTDLVALPIIDQKKTVCVLIAGNRKPGTSPMEQRDYERLLRKVELALASIDLRKRIFEA